LPFDSQEPLHSIPKRFGIGAALWISALLHLAMLGVLGFLFWREGLGLISFLGLVIVGILFGYEHNLIRPKDLSRVNTAFFTVNGWIGILLFATTLIDLLWSGSK
jgi:4-hydroxybenzoate polyprenyltransferase